MLTDAEIQRALRAKKQTQLKEGSGKGTGRLVLSIRVTEKRTIAEWYVQQWLNGRKRTSKLGSYPTLSLAEARKRFNSDFASVIEDKISIKRAMARKQGTVRDLFDGYLRTLEGRSSYKEAKNQLARASAFFGDDKDANRITTGDVIEFLRPTYARGKRVMADAMRSYIRAAFSWGIKSENDYRTNAPRRFMIARNPAESIPTEPKNLSSRWLTVEELRSWWEWLHLEKRTTNHNDVTHSNLNALKLHILLGQRVQEVANITDAMFNRKERLIEWPTTKNGLPHVVPLADLAYEILIATPPNKQGIIFPRLSDPSMPVTHNVLYSIQSRYLERTGASAFSNRDIRRTWKTLAGHAGLTKEERDLIQNHKKPDVSSRHYDRYDYLSEKREAMAKWEIWFRKNINR
jgi:hypothetical protein